MIYIKRNGKWIINKRGTHFAVSLEELYRLQTVTMEIIEIEGLVDNSPHGQKIKELEFKIQQLEAALREECAV